MIKKEKGGVPRELRRGSVSRQRKSRVGIGREGAIAREGGAGRVGGVARERERKGEYSQVDTKEDAQLQVSAGTV